MRLSDCTSFNCQSFDCDYCRKCSHAIYRGSKTIQGREYEWEFNPYHGPLFACKTIGKKDWLPHNRHAVWKAFGKWHDRHFSNAVNHQQEEVNRE